MDKVNINLAVDEHDDKDGELVELGAVTEETKGGLSGWPDGGAGFCWC